jgi:uncharacterized protein (TIGR02145 family)
MNIFKQLCRTLVLSAVVVVLSVGLMGCPPTDPPDDLGTFTDSRDGQIYKTVKIGRQTWMAENLNYVMDSSWCSDGTSDGCATYGRLYNWDAAMIACPSGWRLPDTADWNRLVEAAGGNIAGKKLKARSGWNDNGNGTDDFGFSALPGGYRLPNGRFEHVGMYGNWRTSTEDGSGGVYHRGIGHNDQGFDNDPRSVFELSRDKGYGLSVRCVKDE